MNNLKINKEKCICCGTCVMVCPEACIFAEDGSVQIINEDKLAECGGVDICPVGAIRLSGEME